MIKEKGSVIKPDHDPLELRVVVDRGTTVIQFYVLLNPNKTGICQWRTVNMELVFFVKKY
jgi:hypothetical protein